MKCKDCIYYTGVKCHGHGEYWGNCDILESLLRYVKKVTNCDYISTGFNDIVYDDTECLILKKMGFEVKYINDLRHT